jgi:ElaB/YqjD/DUF883 family membrane-anchored ribosome-binding protein
METNFENLEKAHSIIARGRVLHDLRTLARDAEDLLKATADDVSDNVREARARLGTALESAKATYDEIQGQMVSSARAAAHKADAAIRENPYTCVSTAFALGLLIGVLAVRK